MCNWISLLVDGSVVLWAPQVNSHATVAMLNGVSEDAYCKVEWRPGTGATWDEDGHGPQGDGPQRRLDEWLHSVGADAHGVIVDLRRFCLFLRAHGRGADLAGTDLRAADLAGADLRAAKLHGADLRGADLAGADLRDADLRGVNLRAAKLRGADLAGADLADANLAGADLADADLSCANLSRADLAGADLHGADLAGATLPPTASHVGCQASDG